jgi:hypothetical protein
MPDQHDAECIHGLTPSTCAYCTGSYRREQRALAAENFVMLRRLAARRENAPWGVSKSAGWTVGR